MRVLIIPEDVKKDQYILKPIIRAMLQALGRSHVKLWVCQDPRLRGISQATNWSYLEPIITRYQGMYDVLLLCLDRDGEAGRRAVLNHLEQQAQTVLMAHRVFLAEHAWQEIEVWVLAGHPLPAGWNWQDIRNERDPKEHYYRPFAEQRGVWGKLGQGRKTLAEQATRNYARIRQRCPEDIGVLEERIKQWLQTA
jgi:hypothetical protein